MPHVLHYLSRWCFGLSLGLLGLIPQTVNAFTAVSNDATNTADLTFPGGVPTVTYSYSAKRSGTAGPTTEKIGGVWLYRVSGNGVTTASATIYDLSANGSPTPIGTPTTGSGSFAATAGHWYLLAARQLRWDGGGSYTVVDGPNYTWFQITAAPLTQTVSLSPSGGAGAILTGQTFSGTATGAQAGNPYNISITSGSGGASINPTTGAYTVTAGPTGGIIHYKVWVSAGSGYLRSDDAEANIAVTLSKKVKVTIPANKGKFPVTYKLYQGGVEIGSHLQMPGATAFIVTIDVGANDGEVTMKSFTSGVMSDDGVIVEDEGGNIEETIPVSITPSTDPQTVTPPPAPDVKKPGDAVSTKLPRTKVSWGATGQSTDPESQTDILTNKTYREGVEKQVEQSGIELKLADERPTEDDMSSKGQAAKEAAEESLDNIGASIATAEAPEGEAGSFIVGTGTLSSMISNAWNQAVIGINPVVAWIKALIRWAITLLYVFWVYKELDNKLVTSMMLPQAKGNPILGGTGAQVTGLAAAALISAALLTIPFLLWAAYTTPWDGVANATDSLKNIAAAPIASSLPAVQLAMKWLAWLLPLDMLLAIPAMVLLVKKAGWAIILGVAALIRFIVP